MISFPNAKINIGLYVKDKRPDGFHNLETIFYPLALKDALEIIPFTSPENKIEFTSSGLKIQGSEKDNLCIKAIKLLQKDFPIINNMHMHLHKVIPMGAGLGGGSADAAFTLKLLNEIYELQLSNEQLACYAIMLGSDCPFFIYNQPCFAQGRGQILSPLVINLDDYKFCVINPGIHVNTAQAFADLAKHKTTDKISLQTVINLPVTSWKENIFNDFELPVFEEYPEIRKIKETLYNNNAAFSLLTGSGSSVYGIFRKNAAPVFNFPTHYFITWI